MWGTSSPEDKLAGNLGNVIGAISTGGRRVGFFYSRKLAPSNLGLLQQYRSPPEVAVWALMSASTGCGYTAMPGFVSSVPTTIVSMCSKHALQKARRNL